MFSAVIASTAAIVILCAPANPAGAAGAGAASAQPGSASAQSGEALGPGGVTGPREEPILMEAETTQYQYGSEGTVMVASGNVRASHGDLSVSADHVRINVDAGDLLARGNVVVRRGSSTIKCTLFAYNLKARTGRVLDPDAAVPGVYVRGKEMDVEPDRFALAGAHATGCDLKNPCHRVTTRRLMVYPDRRVVAEWPVVWLEHAPVLVLPGLTLPVRGARVGWVEGEGYPVPRFAYDPKSGLVVGLAYLDRSREDLAIRYEGAYLSGRKGIEVQARADMRPRPGQSATLIGGLRSWEGLYASGEWKLAISNAISLEADARYSAGGGVWGGSGTQGGPGMEGGLAIRAVSGPVAAKAVARKDLHSSGAAYSLPAVELTTSPVRLPGTPAILSLSGGAGRFEEPGRGVLTTRAYAELSAATVPLRLTEGLTCSLGLDARRAWYGTGDLLDAVTTRIGLRGSFGALEAFGASVPRVGASLGYTHKTVSGATPFAFDKSNPLNEVTAGVAVRMNRSWTAGLAGTYDLAGDAVKDVDLSLVNHHHCFDIRATWGDRRKEFGLEVRFTR